jgi:hypothetical protein
MGYNKNVDYRLGIQRHIPSIPIQRVESVSSQSAVSLFMKYQFDLSFDLFCYGSFSTMN